MSSITILNNPPQGPSLSWTVADLLAATGGELLCGDRNRVFAGISIDSRRLAADDLFVAIRGQTHDGHDFLPDAVTVGIQGVIVQRSEVASLGLDDLKKRGLVIIAVKDTIRCLGDLAHYNRNRAGISVVAVTGSNGKTSTKDMTAAILSRRFRTLSTSGNLNNEIGMPLTLLKLEPGQQWAVLELGMNHPGEIRRLAEICQPDIGIITNIGPAHLEGLGSIDGVMQAKGELLEKIKAKGTAVLNADDPKVQQLARTTRLAVLSFGLSSAASVRADSIEITPKALHFRLVLPAEKIDITLSAAGRFMVYNALAAAAAGTVLRFSAADIKTGLENFKAVDGRMNIIQTRKQIAIIDDTYNANPVSMRAAIVALDEFKKDGRSILILGDMRELGDQAEALHREIGTLAAQHHVVRMYLTGEYAEAVRAGAMEKGLNADSIFIGSHAEILDDLPGRLAEGDWVLVKGSRAMKMEKIVTGLRNWANTDD